MAEYSREQRYQLSRTIGNSGAGCRQMKVFVDNRNKSTAQFTYSKVLLNSYDILPIQKAPYNFTNSLGDTHTVYLPQDILTALDLPFQNWKNTTVTTSGHAPGNAVKMLSSQFNQLSSLWRRRQDKMRTIYKSPITFSIGSSLSGGAGMKHLKAECFQEQANSFIWHVKVVPD